MILGPTGEPIPKVVDTRFDPQLLVMLRALDDVLRQNGLGLHCMKCNRSGVPDGVICDNVPGSDTFSLRCSCANRVFNTQTGKEHVHVN